MSDRRRGHSAPRDADGEPLIDAGVLIGLLGMTPAGARKWAASHGLRRIRRGAHGANLYRLTDVQQVLQQTNHMAVSSGSPAAYVSLQADEQQQ